MKNLMGILFLFLTTLCSSQCVNHWPEFPNTDMSRFNACESVLGTNNVGQLSLLWSYLPSQQVVQTSPVVVNGVVYFGTHEGNFYAVNSTTGAEIWERHIGAPFASSPAVGPNLVYFDSGPSLFALHRVAGAVAWKLKTGVSCSSPVVAGDVVYAAAGCTDGGTIFAVTAKKGKKLWSYTPAGGVAQFVASPVVADGIVYDTDMGNNSYAVDARTGNLLWEFSPGGYGGSFGAPAVANGVAFLSSDAGIYAVDAKSGRQLWGPGNGGGQSSPAVANGILYVGSNQGEGGIYALNTANGSVLWNFNTSGSDDSPAVANGVVYEAGYDGYLYALDATSGEALWNYNLELGGANPASSPAEAKSTVYIGGPNGLYAFGLARK